MVSSRPDVIVVGSGLTGGWAVKTLTDAHLRVLLIERGPEIDHGSYPTEHKEPWQMQYLGSKPDELLRADFGASHSRAIDEYNEHFFVREADAPYDYSSETPFKWIRGHQLGGRSLTWGRGVLRWAQRDFEANRLDGHGLPWPLSYDDLRPWYEKVETFAGVSGNDDELPHWPAGQYQPPFELNALDLHIRNVLQEAYPDRTITAPRLANLTVSKNGRQKCAARDRCSRGCSLGAYFSTNSAILPAARQTGLLQTLTDTRVVRISLSSATGRPNGVVAISERTGKPRLIEAKAIVLAASAFSSVHILLNTRSELYPNGLGGGSGLLGRYLMDHVLCDSATGRYPGLNDAFYLGRRPGGPVIPRFRNLGRDRSSFLRGYFFSAATWREGWTRRITEQGFGLGFERSIGIPGSWRASLAAFGECLPYPENFATLSHKQDRYGVPLLKIHVAFGANEQSIAQDAMLEGKTMLERAGFADISGSDKMETPGSAIHEMGGACMGFDPSRSVTTPWSRLHGEPNVVIADGSVMCSSACQSPSLTFMALAARACSKLAADVRNGRL